MEEIPGYTEQILLWFGDKNMFSERYGGLKTGWEDLMLSVKNFRENPDKENSSALLAKSEEVWQESERMDSFFDDHAQRKMRYLVILTGGIAFNVLFLILMLVLLRYLLRGRLERNSFYDSLTETFNKKVFDEILEKEIDIAVRYKRRFHVLVIDTDRFKKIRDQYGHETGDSVIQRLAGVIRENSRSSDILIRSGADEFFLIDFDEDTIKVLGYAEKLRQAVEKSHFPGVGNITISMGVTIFKGKDDSKDEILRRAEEAVNLAKRNGRNRVELRLEY